MDYLYQLIGTPTAASTAHQVKDIHDACGGKVTSFSLDRAQKVIAKYSDPEDADSKYYKRIEDLFSTGPYTSSQEAFLRKCCGLDPIDQLVSARLPHPAQSKILKLGPVVRRMARKQIDDSLAGIESALKNSPIL